MGDHIFKKKDPTKHHKLGFSEGQDIDLQRKRRVSFKTYVKQLEEELLSLEIDEDQLDDQTVE
jgi:hypothetical protein